MMIFDANSGEFWQIFARQGMRNLRNPRLECGATLPVDMRDIEGEHDDDSFIHAISGPIVQGFFWAKDGFSLTGLSA